ncbi:toxin-antitoxin system, toxin component [Salmonella enterica subsp. houtenae]|nr:toxin-antitoxin system, toxin component [Salmonella enterica subsp. houtenae]
MKQRFVCMRLKFNINFREEINTYMKLKKHAKYLCMKKCILFNYFYCFS